MAEAATPALPARLAAGFQRYELTLTDYWRILIKRRSIVFLAFVSTLAVTIIYTNTKTPLYQSSSVIRITAGPRAFSGDMAMMSRFSYTDVMATYESMISSQEVMKRVVLRLGLLTPLAKSGDLNEWAGRIGGAVTAKQVGTTDMIEIQVIYPNAELSAAIANETARAFMEVDLLEKTRQARTVRRFIEEQLEIFMGKLKEAENRLREFRASGRALGIAAGMEQRLSDLEKERNILLKQYTEKHPDIIKLDDQVQGIRERIKKLPADELELARVQRELEINDRGYRMMKEKYEQARLAEAEQVADVTVVDTATVPAIPISPRKNLNKLTGAAIGLILGVILALVRENMDASIGTIEDVEGIVGLPVMGVVPYFDPGAQEVPWWRIEHHLLDLLKRQQPKPPDASFLIMNQETSSTLAEAYRILRTFVEFLIEKGREPGAPQEGKVLVLTSTGPQEGKSLTVCNLAISLAQAGKKTLLIDADLRRPTVHRFFGLKREPGLADVLLGTVNLMEARKTLGDILIGEASNWDSLLVTKMLDRLEILTTGIHTTTPAELLGSEALKQVVQQARLQYDYVIFDTPPVLPVTDARALGVLADATFFVYRAGKTPRRALTRARDELKLAGVQVKGIILNQATPEITLTDQYYYQYYGEKKDKKKTPPAIAKQPPQK